KYSAKLSHREIARSLNISPGTVANYVKKANELGLNQWPLTEISNTVLFLIQKSGTSQPVKKDTQHLTGSPSIRI
ncbi:winged helix-turn-helix transcriptional regulator, partial [Pseudoalteromonas ostreae]|uniref:winged helix-turn-helix transcriptional regulator n=1 Tax=Pseudoalteromonas ostreae TaxID=2774154 RepID=UPI0039EEB37F